jgi:hypothetical protein
MRFLLIFYFILTLFLFPGCYTLRKKFVRKKKYRKKTPVYVDFKEYPEKPSYEAYLDYYLFTRGWLDELIDSLKKGDSFKRAKRAINEAVMNLEQIIYFYNSEGKEEIYPLYEELISIKEEIQKFPNMSEIKRNFLASQVERIKRRFEANFNYRDAKKWMD